jgi:alpha,alpha-trehalose phosphorylase
MVNNNYYTNASAAYNLRCAADLYEKYRDRTEVVKLTKDLGITDLEIDAMKKAADAMYLPYDEDYGINPQDDAFLDKPVWDLASTPKEDFPLLLHYHPLFLYRHKVCKQADTILAHLMFPETTDMETARRSFAYYDSITTHDSSLSECVYAMQAARLGDLARGAHGFEQTALLDIDDSHGNTKDGLHTASLGGAYLTVLRGFAGIRSEHGELSADPVLPDDWEGYRLPFRFHGRELLLTCSREHGAQLMLQSGEPLDVRFCGSHITLTQTM